MKLYILLTVVQPPRALRRTLLLQKTRHLNEITLAIMVRIQENARVRTHHKQPSALLVNNGTALMTAGISTLNKHLSGGQQTSRLNLL
jgi:hypothetical protein